MLYFEVRIVPLTFECANSFFAFNAKDEKDVIKIVEKACKALFGNVKNGFDYEAHIIVMVRK